VLAHSPLYTQKRFCDNADSGTRGTRG
jgi:hypothetical protein